jgi:TRAP-type C4-dicarboxylate transport system substrate-binding protein
MRSQGRSRVNERSHGARGLEEGESGMRDFFSTTSGRPRRVGRLASASAAAVAVAALAAGCGSSDSGGTGSAGASAGSGKSYTLRLSTDLVVPGVPYNDQVVGDLPKAVSTATNGKVKIKIYPNNELYKDQGLALAAAQRGQIDMVITNNLHAQPIIPAMDGPSLAFVAPTIDQYYKVLAPDTPFFKEANKEAEAKGLEIIPVSASSPGTGGVIFKGKTPETSLNAIHGQKVRVPGAGLLADELKDLGAQSIVLSTTEVAPAINAGTVSAAVATASFAKGELKGLVHGYLDSGTFQVGPYFMFASKQAWDALSPEAQAGIAKGASQVVDSWLPKIAEQQDAADKQLQSDGLWVNKLPQAEATKLAAQFQGSVWQKFKAQDPEAYNALVQTRKQLGIS